MKALVTGGAGFIGRALVSSLLEKDCEVIVIDSGDTSDLNAVPSSAELVERDIGKIGELEWTRLMGGVERVFHLAARKYNTPGVTPSQLLETNVNATWKIAEAAASARVERFVFTSSLYAYGALGPEAMRESDVPAPTTLYGASKLMGEHILRTLSTSSNLKWSCARLFFIYGPGQHAEGGYKSVIVTNFDRLREGLAPTICGDGCQALDYVYLSDAVSALEALSDAETEALTINVASGQPQTINALTKLMQQTAGTDLAPLQIEADWTAGTERFGDPGVAADRLGWSVSVEPADGLQRTWESLKR